MKPLLFHSYEVKIAERRRQVLSIFIACHNLTSNDFDAEITREISASTGLDFVRIVGYQDDIDKVRGWLGSEGNVSFDRLRSVVGNDDGALCFIAFAPAVGSHVGMQLDGSLIDGPDILATERQQSLLAAFCEAGGEQRAATGTHFAKTSDTHAERFLNRPGNRRGCLV